MAGASPRRCRSSRASPWGCAPAGAQDVAAGEREAHAEAEAQGEPVTLALLEREGAALAEKKGEGEGVR